MSSLVDYITITDSIASPETHFAIVRNGTQAPSRLRIPKALLDMLIDELIKYKVENKL